MSPTNTSMDLHIDPASFDATRAIDLKRACRDVLRGRSGRKLSLQMAQRYARQGCRPQGGDGPLLMLPTVLWSGKRLLMPEWAIAFELTRVRLGMGRATA